MHILPRRPGDFQRNDDVYDVLEDKTHVDEEEHRRPRTLDEMAAEAAHYTTLFGDEFRVDIEALRKDERQR